MDITNLNSAMVSYQRTTVTNVSAKGSANTSVQDVQEQGAVFEKSPKVESGDYSERISAMIADSQRKIAEFQNMFARYLGGQASNYDIAKWSKENMQAAFANATPEDVAAAKAAISEGGYYSVDSVATRIMDMAYALSGGDPSKIELLRDAVQKGFDQAGAIYGAELPQICQDTYTEIMGRFDAWADSAEMKSGETE